MCIVQKIASFLQPVRRRVRPVVRRLHKLSTRPRFHKVYPVVSVAILLLTTVWWALLGARLQGGNADQLADPYLFRNWATFHGATFPGAHSFLLKWPIFALVSLFGASTASLAVATIAVALLTVGALAWLLYEIDRRPLVFGTTCLALALALLLIPTQPYAGGLLPVNMAMLATRNLEYVVYLGALVLFARAGRFRSRAFLGGMVLLALLIASDKLFLSLSAGGALLALVAYALVRNWVLVTFSVRWLAASLLAAAGSTILLLTISALHITHLANESGAGPYSLVTGPKDLVLASVYGVFGFLTNFGANPAYDATVLRQLPGHLLARLESLSGLAHLLALAVLLYALVQAYRLASPSLKEVPRRAAKATVAIELSFSLLWSTVAALAVFVATKHYYAVDARYLTVGLFALAITVATALRKKRWQKPERLVLVGAVLAVGIVISGFAAHGTYQQQKAALATVTERNSLVAQALEKHKVGALVGDYWRVLPIRQASGGAINALPLGDCTQPRTALSSTVWQPDLRTHSFAYLLSLDQSLTDFPHCSLPQIIAAYGRPNATQIVAGTHAKPTEVLLFYDHGSHKSAPPLKGASTQATVLPIGLEQLVGTNCSVPTIFNVVAHQDDDLLFTSPDLLHDIQAGHCIRTVFLTAGDSGYDKLYWLNRQLGSEAAYNVMLGKNVTWDQQTVELASGEYVTVASPRGNSKVSLVFFNLPDGDIHGEGFAASNHESLAKLYADSIATIHSVDGQSTYSAVQLEQALSVLMNTYQPAEIRTQADVPSSSYPDHSDHIATGQFTEAAAVQYDQSQFGGAITIPVKRYIGYPIHGYPSNVSDEDLREKEMAFLAYARYDGGVCHSLIQCAQTPTYGAYISRQYQQAPDGQ